MQFKTVLRAITILLLTYTSISWHLILCVRSVSATENAPSSSTSLVSHPIFSGETDASGGGSDRNRLFITHQDRSTPAERNASRNCPSANERARDGASGWTRSRIASLIQSDAARRSRPSPPSGGSIEESPNSNGANLSAVLILSVRSFQFSSLTLRT